MMYKIHGLVGGREPQLQPGPVRGEPLDLILLALPSRPLSKVLLHCCLLFLMALSASPRSLPLCRLPRASCAPATVRSSLSFRLTATNHSRMKPILIRSSLTAAPTTSGGLTPAITLTDKALNHLNKMRSDRNEDLCLRIGVKQGGCSGMSYAMEFENRANASADDSIIEYNGFVIVTDPQSLLFLYGMQLDFSDALIGGGFSFKNPNATQTCGCGKSFAAEM